MQHVEIATVTKELARQFPRRPATDPGTGRPGTLRFRLGGLLVRTGLALQRRPAGPARPAPRAA